ncbi:hypothetical protein INR49_004120 [Caranx melampygus]|nr:hypothetical protein INR49_004120 [Caranx melampygus]
MPDTLMKAGEPLPCSVTNCPNCITPGSAFIMCARQMEYRGNAGDDTGRGSHCGLCGQTHSLVFQLPVLAVSGGGDDGGGGDVGGDNDGGCIVVGIGG